MNRPPTPVPVTVVTGFHGAGKTTAIRRWVGERPEGERWAVLVNDFGVLSMDRAAFEDTGVEVHPVAGGCACCTGALAMRVALARVLRRGPWHRLLIELSGLGHPAALIDALHAAATGAAGARVDGVVAVVDAGRPGPWLDADSPDRALAQAQADAADTIVLARAGAAPRDTLERLRAALAAGPFGAREVLRDAGGPPDWPRVADALAAARSGALGGALGGAVGGALGGASATALAHGGRRWRRATPEGEVLAWCWPAELRFDRQALQGWSARLARDARLVRARGAFRTERDWYLWQCADGGEQWAPTAWRRDNRVECLFLGPADPGALDSALLDALLGARPGGR